MRSRHNGLGSLCLQKLYQMVVGSRQEFYQDLADDADFRFLLVGDRNVVKFPDDLTADLHELAVGRITAGDEFLADAHPIFTGNYLWCPSPARKAASGKHSA